jgi:two-component system sensor histidine kinase/response regulator
MKEANTGLYKRARILIVDDNPTNIELLKQILGDKGYEVMVALSGEAALKLVSDIKPNLILLDVMMPGIDGYDTCKELKSNDKTKEIPVIFITAKTEPSDIVKGFAVGGVDYVTKPLQIEELIARVDTHIQLRQTMNELSFANAMMEGMVQEKYLNASDVSDELKKEIRLTKKSEEKLRLYIEHLESQLAEKNNCTELTQ